MVGPEAFNLTGRKAVVTGGGTGLGYAMAQALAAMGATVLIAGRRTGMLMDATEQLRAAVPGATLLHETVDLYDMDDVLRFAKVAADRLGGVDIFVGNAGAVHAQSFGAITPKEVDRTLQLNLSANIALSQSFAKPMMAQRWGRILFSSSTAAHLAAPLQGNLAYAAAKSGMNGFMRVIAAELGRFGITVNSLILGVFWTSILREAVTRLRDEESDDAAEALIDGFVEMTALGRLGEPEDLHGLVQLLASDAGRYITGASFPVDGGTSIMMRPWPVTAAATIE
nr:SDR family oxidoreductase [Sphingomonas sp. CDS-1]